MADSATSGGLIICLNGPTACGKNTLAHRLVEADPAVTFMVTATSRSPRAGEKDGINYHYFSRDDFKARIEKGELLEHDIFNGNYYGTPVWEAEKHFKAGKDVVTDITWPGVVQIKKKMPERVLALAILPPTYDAMMERVKARMAGTGEQSLIERAELFERVRHDMDHWHDDAFVFTNEDMRGAQVRDYDRVIINDDLDRALAEMRETIDQARKVRG